MSTRTWLIAAAALLAASHARADCAAGIDAALHRAQALPDTPGKAALMEQILRAENEHHEGDEEGCGEELSIAQQALDQVAR